MLRNVYLYGEAGRLFGRKFRLDVSSLAEAVRALGILVPGFKHYVTTHNFQCVRGKSRKSGYVLDEAQVPFNLGASDLHITPVIAGAGGKGAVIGKIIAGILLAGFAFFTAPALTATIGGTSITYGNLVTAGLGMAFLGVSQLLSAQPKKKDEEDKGSSTFSNVPQVSEQGEPVPLLYGRFMVRNPPLISTGVITSDVGYGNAPKSGMVLQLGNK